MRQRLYLLIGTAAMSALLLGCGSRLKAEESTVYVTKQGAILGASIEDFSADYYDKDELENFITESVEDYVSKNGDGTVKLEDYQIKEKDDGKSAQLYLEYAGYLDYAQFNGVEMYVGTVASAREAGYELDLSFLTVEDGAAGESVAGDQLPEDAKLVILGEDTVLKIDGEIMYVSEGNAEVTGKTTAKLQYDLESTDATPAYVVYR